MAGLSSPCPPDILAVLTWQSEQLSRQTEQQERMNLQLARMQQQVARLLAGETESVEKSVATSATASPGSQTWNTVATNTSLAWADSQQQQSENGCAVAGGGGDRSSSSLVLGESVSMYAVNDAMDQHCDNILGQMRRLLAQPAPDTPDPSVTASQTRPAPAPSPAPASQALSPLPSQPFPALHGGSHPPLHNLQPALAPQPVPAELFSKTAAWERLRQLGVSFISPNDLSGGTESGAGAGYSTVFLPRAGVPQLARPGLQSSASPDTSLAINNLALKYLSDSELVRLADRHGVQQQPGPAPAPGVHQELSGPGGGVYLHQSAPGGHQEQPGPGFYQQPPAADQLSHPAPARQTRPAAPFQHMPPTAQQFQPVLPASSAPAFQPVLQPAPAPSQQFQPALPPGPAPQFDRVLDVTAIRQQSKLL